MSKKFALLILLAVLLFGAAFWFNGSGTFSLGTAGTAGIGWSFIPILIIAALIDSINPCAFSVLLITIAFLFSLGRGRREIYRIGGVYIGGLFVVYVLIGLGILGTLTLFNAPHVMARIGAFILVAFGVLDLLGEFFPSFPIKLKIPDAAHGEIAHFMNRASIPAAAALGVLVGLFEFPCTGGPYLFVLGLLHDQQTSLIGFGYLILYNLIFVSPLVVILALAADETVLGRIQEWRKTNIHGLRFWSGILALLLGLLMLFVSA
jgi:cytochrome c-type biogenesis protein